MSSPWSDPATETEQGAPYAGPPVTAPLPPWGAQPAGVPVPYGTAPYGTAPYGTAPYGAPPYGTAPYGAPPYGMAPYGAAPYGAPWPVPPAGPRRAGQVIAAAVLTFVQAAVVTVASAYVVLLASVFTLAAADAGLPGDGGSLADEGTALAAVQVLSVVTLVAGGVMALNRRSRAARRTLMAALGVQVALAVYWAVRLSALLDDAGGPDPSVFLLFGVLCFAAAPAVGLGLLVSRQARRWFAGGSSAREPGAAG